jgi:hypothetical protein
MSEYKKAGLKPGFRKREYLVRYDQPTISVPENQ